MYGMDLLNCISGLDASGKLASGAKGRSPYSRRTGKTREPSALSKTDPPVLSKSDPAILI